MGVVLPSHCFWRRRQTMQRPPSPFVAPLLLFFLFFHLRSQTIWAQPTPSPDALALIRFRQQITADPTGNVYNSWNVNSLDHSGCPKNWYGVNCSQDGVVTLMLDNLALEGQVVSGTLGNLYSLLNLSLSNNSFRGKLPNDFEALSKLTYVDLSENRFVGDIPDSLVNLPALTNLSLAGNGLNGSIPSKPGMSLQNLDLSRNKLVQSIPFPWTQLQRLVALNLSSNNLDGVIPPRFSDLILLETLDLHGNQLSGNVDSALLVLNKSWYVDLSSNNFTGRLPLQLTSPGVTVVQHLNLSHNRFQDSFSSVVFTSSLSVLDISYNQLYGPLSSFQYASALTSLRLNNNKLSGSIPATLFQSPSMLTELDLSANQLQGSFKDVTSNFLTVINLSNNALDGTLPTSLGSCKSLDLSYNKLHGDVSVMQNWGQILQRLDLSHNQLTGPMADLTPFPQLIYLNFSQNQLSGTLPDPFASSQVLSVVDLSSNQFGAGIPRSFFYSSITSLLLSHNQFSGPIPISDNSSPSSAPPLVSPSHLEVLADTTQLAPLVVLDLSSNGLSGSIPEKIGSIPTLEVLNLSNNSLSGRIPSQFDGLNFLQDLDLSMNQLSGPIPPLLPNSLTQLNVSRNNLSGPIPKSLSRFPNSSFFPGNPGLTLSGGGSGPERSPSGGVPKNSNSKAGLIGGITAGAVVVVLIGVFVYCYRYPPKSKGSTPASEFGGSQRGFEQYKAPAGVNPAEFEGDLEHGAPNALPVVAAGKSVNSRKGKSSPTKAGSPEPKVGNDVVERDTGPTDSQRLPAVREDVLSPEHPLVSKVSPEHPVAGKVDSTEQLVGDVFFLDKTLSCSAEDLSRAPAEVLGRSNHGTSYKATLDGDHALVVKWLKEELAKSRKEFGTEAKKFGNIKHQNIKAMKGFYCGPGEHEKLILSDYLVGESLADRIQERADLPQPTLTWPQRLKVAVDVSCGLLYLHAKHRWAHGNIKASNILLIEDSNFEARLSDFSLHRLMTPAGVENQVVNSGALGYCAPELVGGKKLTPSMKSDVFSFGVILMELITGKSAGDIVSASTGIVDLPDWVKVVANEGHAIDCYDTALVGVDRDIEPPKGIEKVLALSLSCAGPQSSRPSMRVVHEGLAAINPE